MSDTAVTGIRDISITKRAAKKQDSNISYFKKLKKSGSLVLIAAMFSIGAALALAGNIPVKNVMKNYSYDVLVILMIMELFTNLIAETNIMQLIAVKIAEISKGRKRLCLMMFGGMISCGTKLHARNIPVNTTQSSLSTSKRTFIFLYWLLRFDTASLRIAPSSSSRFTCIPHTVINIADVNANKGKAWVR